MEKEVKEIRIYRFKKEYSIECYEEIENDGSVFTKFYLTDGLNKMFCVGCQIKEGDDEAEIADSILEEYLPDFLEEQRYLEEKYEKEMEGLFIEDKEES